MIRNSNAGRTLMANHLLVELLADGNFHSGESLGAALGLTRSAVWKHIQGFAALGLRVDAIRGKGYRIAGGLDLLNREGIQAALSVGAMADIKTLDVFDAVDSTNEVALSRVRAGDIGRYVCLAEYQTAGRGRRNRRWVSPYAANIYLSMVREFSGGVAAIDGLSLVVGVAVCEALESLGIDGVGLKWPNDLVVGPAKLGGILIEISGDLAGSCLAVIGIGINVSMPGQAMDLAENIWTDLSCIGKSGIRRNAVAAALLNSLCPALAEFQRDGLPAFVGRWRRLDVVMGRNISLLIGDAVIVGVAEGIDASGSLLVSTMDDVRAYRSGEVSVRNWA